MKTHNSMNSKNLTFQIISLVVAICFIATTISWSAPDLCLRQKAAIERRALDAKIGTLQNVPARSETSTGFISRALNAKKGEAGFLGFGGIAEWLLERRCIRLAKKAGLVKGTEAFNLAVRLGIKMYEKGIDPRHTYTHDIPAIVQAAKTKEELKLFLQFGIRLTERNIDPRDTCRLGIPAIAQAAKNTEELNLFLQLGIRLAEKGIDPYKTFTNGIPAIAKVAKTPQELTLFLRLGIRLAEKGIDPGYTYEYGIPAITNVARTPEELNLFLQLGTRLADRGIDPGGTYAHGIPVIIQAAKTPEQLNQFLQLGTRLAEKGINPQNTFQYGIPVITQVARTPEELSLFLQLGTRLAEKGIIPDLTNVDFAEGVWAPPSEKGIDPWLTFQYGIPAIAHIPKTPEQLNLCLIALEGLVTRLEKKGIDSQRIFQVGIPAIAKVVKTTEELKLVLRTFESLAITLKEGGIEPQDAILAAIQEVVKTPTRFEGSAAKIRQFLIEFYTGELKAQKETLQIAEKNLKDASANLNMLLAKKESTPPTIIDEIDDFSKPIYGEGTREVWTYWGPEEGQEVVGYEKKEVTIVNPEYQQIVTSIQEFENYIPRNKGFIQNSETIIQTLENVMLVLSSNPLLPLAAGTLPQPPSEVVRGDQQLPRIGEGRMADMILAQGV